MKEKIINVIIDVLKNAIESGEIDSANWDKVTEDTILFGEDDSLDSMDFVNLMVEVEEKIFEVLDTSITIVSEKAFSKKYNPFKNVERLAEFILELQKEDN